MNPSPFLTLLAAAAPGAAGLAHAQIQDACSLGLRAHALAAGSACLPGWLPTFGGEPGMDGAPYTFAVFDDGGGPALYAGGSFKSAGGVGANRIAKWDGASWAPLGSGLGGVSSVVFDLAVFDDGSGPALYAGGIFTSVGGVAANHVAKWDGSSWSSVGSGMNDQVLALEVFDDGGGPALYAAGYFVSAGGIPASHIAKWDGASWAPLGSGINSTVASLAVFDDGGGPALFAAGGFISAGGAAASCIAKWDGSSWSALGSGVNNYVRALAVFDDGGGPALHAGGDFTTAGGAAADHCAKWNGASWTSLPDGLGFTPQAFAVFDDGGGPALYAGGFTTPGVVSPHRIAKWDGAAWSPVLSGVDSSVASLGVFDGGAGEELFVGGFFTAAGGVAASFIATWDGSTWSAIGNGLDKGVLALKAFDDGGGAALYAGGLLSSAGGVSVNRIGRWDGGSWSPLASGITASSGNPQVFALEVFNAGGGPALYAGGRFDAAGGVAASHIARWDGSSWSPLGSGVAGAPFSSPEVDALAVFDDGLGPALYAGGRFTQAGAVAASSIAKWDGTTWSPLASGVSGTVHSLAVFDDGGGPALYAGGTFSTVGGVPMRGIARWDGSAWSPVGGGMTGLLVNVSALAVFDDGRGPALYAGGTFPFSGGLFTNNIARWDGSSWSPLEGGITGPPGSGGSVHALAVFDDGGGPALYAGGIFHTAGEVPAASIARWDGSSWSAVGSGTSLTTFGAPSSVSALAVFHGGGVPGLYAGGTFSSALDSGDSYLARWACPAMGIIPGCAGNPATLYALAPSAPLGAPLPLQITGAAALTGLGLVFAGAPGFDAAGCGPLVPGIGELLLAIAPLPVSVASGPLAGGTCALAPVVPPNPALSGKVAHLNALAVDPSLPSPLELTNALAVLLGP